MIPKKKHAPAPRSGSDDSGPPNVLDAAERMDYDALVEAVNRFKDGAAIQTNDRNQNALHILVLGGSVRTYAMMAFLLNNTYVKTHGRDIWGRDPLDLAIELKDEEAVLLIAPHWFAESQRRQDLQHSPDISPVDPKS